MCLGRLLAALWEMATNFRHIVGIVLTSTLVSCAPAGFSFSQSQYSQTDGDGAIPPIYEDPGNASEGIIGGHFDLDTSHLVYGPSAGTTDHHVHEYDDKYKTNGADFFNLAESGLGKIQATIAPTKRFILIVANAELSRGGILEVNGSVTNVLAAQDKNRAQLGMGVTPQIYTIGPSSAPDDVKLGSLKLYFDKNVIAQSGLIPTATGCVRKNQPGAKGEYRNGALVLQALDAEKFKIDPATGVASATDGGLLWEATVFWHRDSTCY